MTKEDIIDILVKRDEIPVEEAREIVTETYELIYEALVFGDYNEVEQIMMDQLGLEMDYVFAFI